MSFFTFYLIKRIHFHSKQDQSTSLKYENFLDAYSQMQIQIHIRFRLQYFRRGLSLSNADSPSPILKTDLDIFVNFQKNLTSSNSDKMGLRYRCTKTVLHVF